DQFLNNVAEILLLAVRRFPSCFFFSSRRFGFIAPLLLVVFPLVGVESRKQAGQIVVVGVFEILADQRRRIRVMHQIVVEELLARRALPWLFVEDRLMGLKNVTNQRAQENDVAARSQGSINVSHRGGPREARIDVNDRAWI